MYITAQSFSLIEDEAIKNLFDIKIFSQEKLHDYLKIDITKLINEIKFNINKASTTILILDEWIHFSNSFLGITTYFSGKDIKYDSIFLALSIPYEFDRT